jgi:DNA-binding transcriptional LysR family regulator
MFTLDQIRGFVAVAEELHFGRAAERLHMTQPPLSRQIQKLERTLETRLLDRSSRGVQLTAAGPAFLADCRRNLQAATVAARRTRLVASGRAGLLRIGYTAISGFSVLGSVLTAIEQELPGIEVELQELVTSRQIEALHDGSIDLALARPPFPEEMDSMRLVEEGLLVALPTDHPLARETNAISAAALRGERLIMHSATHARYFHDLVTQIIQVDPRQVSHVVTQVVTILALVSAGRGVALVPESVRNIQVTGVELRPLEESTLGMVRLDAAWLRSASNPALHQVRKVLTHLE